MELDQAKIDAAVSTLTDALGTTCNVEVSYDRVERHTGRKLLGLPIVEHLYSATTIVITANEE